MRHKDMAPRMAKPDADAKEKAGGPVGLGNATARKWSLQKSVGRPGVVGALGRPPLVASGLGQDFEDRWPPRQRGEVSVTR